MDITRDCRVPLPPELGDKRGKTAYAKWGGNAEQDRRPVRSAPELDARSTDPRAAECTGRWTGRFQAPLWFLR